MKRIIILLSCIIIAGAAAVISVNRSVHLWNTENSKDITQKKHKKVPKKARIADLKKYMNGIHMPFGATNSPAPANYLYEEFLKTKNAGGKFNAARANVEWIHRGPSNVGGRTRGLIVDPDDATHHTWFAGSATGGVWKTTDAGANWECLTDELPYQATTTLAMANSNHNVIYMGTGESFTYDVCGGGIFKSINKGETWEHLSSTSADENFRFVNRIEVDPDNEDIVLVATTSGIFKSVDGGVSWNQTYTSENSVEDLVADTSNFNYIFASVNGQGILRSSDAGDTWDDVTNGFAAGYGRIELAISPVNPLKIFASVEDNDPDSSSLYISWDRGTNWQLLKNNSGPSYNYLGGQGWYDNTIAAHPYDENIVYCGGVNLWKVNVSSTVQDGSGSVSEFDTNNTSSFLEFIDFGGLFPGMNTGDMEEAYGLEEDKSDFVSIEIRFGPGMMQKAHRFYVPLHDTSGVPSSNYTYQNYIDVPFEVWDVTNNRQLMCSFRDQERDGEFNLYEATGSGYGEQGREYIFIHAVPYNASAPDANIAVTGGRSYKLLYFFWPTLVEGGSWDPDNLPSSEIFVEWSIIQERLGTVSKISDAYGSSGENPYNQSAGLNTTSIPGFHPDHHEIYMIPVNDATKDFWVLNANDGGLGISYDKGVNFTQIKNNYYTTQFYGVAKKPYRNEYIGGMQDNGTWQSQIGSDATLDSGFYFRIGGDGFETIWNKKDTNKIMGSVYYNSISVSVRGGRGFTDYTDGIADDDGPFITRLTPVPSNNDIVFALGARGVYKTARFGIGGWRLTNIGTGWNIINNNEPSKPYWHHVEVSPANEQIVWAGAGMYNSGNINLRMFISEDQGATFSAVNLPAEPVPTAISGFEVHPTQENTAYALYSLYNYPKILRTTDRGATWEDITQVGEDGISTNGFPNVGVYSLLVFPDSTDIIWAGTEIGIMESNDNGETWHYLESNLPAVAIWQIFAQDNQVVAATYGRGIWTYQYGPELEPPVAIETELELAEQISVYPNPSEGLVNIALKGNIPTGNYLVTVYSLNGGRLINREFSYTGNPMQLDLSDLNEGSYIISLSSDEINYSTRIVLQ